MVTIDVHTHVYLPEYLALLRTRCTIPRLEAGTDGREHLLILPGEDVDESTSAGRPIGAEYSALEEKLGYMDRHRIDISVISLANPWLDHIQSADESAKWAARVNDQLQSWADRGQNRIYAFGVVGLVDVHLAVRELERMATDLRHLKGIIMSTRGLGSGLEDPNLLPLYDAAQRLGLVIFVHPHYGLGNESMAGYGHVLPLALGFPFETTTAIARLILSGLLDHLPRLKILVAHAGGVLPYLAGRLDACVKAAPDIASKLKQSPTAYLRQFWYDGIVYSPSALQALINLVGEDRIMFGTDHPFFPPADGPTAPVTWDSATSNRAILEELGEEIALRILGQNAEQLLKIDCSQCFPLH